MRKLLHLGVRCRFEVTQLDEAAIRADHDRNGRASDRVDFNPEASVDLQADQLERGVLNRMLGRTLLRRASKGICGQNQREDGLPHGGILHSLFLSIAKSMNSNIILLSLLVRQRRLGAVRQRAHLQCDPLHLFVVGLVPHDLIHMLI